MLCAHKHTCLCADINVNDSKMWMQTFCCENLSWIYVLHVVIGGKESTLLESCLFVWEKWRKVCLTSFFIHTTNKKERKREKKGMLGWKEADKTSTKEEKRNRGNGSIFDVAKNVEWTALLFRHTQTHMANALIICWRCFLHPEI